MSVTPDAPRPDLDEAEHPMDLDEALAWLRFAAQGQRVDPTDRDVARAVLAALAERDAEIARLRAALALHRPIPRKGYDHLTVCAEDGQVWPCRTRQTLTEEEA